MHQATVRYGPDPRPGASGRRRGPALRRDPQIRAVCVVHSETSAGVTSRLPEVRAAIDRRDRLDSTRAVSPLVAAPDALQIDTTGRSAADVVRDVVDAYRAKTGAPR